MTIEYVSIGELTLDETVFEDQVRRNQPGGGALYSALGIQLWGHIVGLNAVVGEDYPKGIFERLEKQGVSVAGVGRVPGWSLRLWLLHEEHNLKQQLPKLQSADVQRFDAVRPDPPDVYWSAQGFHLAPATPAGQMRARDAIRRNRPDALISLDLFVGPSIDLQPYRTGDALRGIDIFSPSLFEVESLWPGEQLGEVVSRLADFGVRWVAIKMDTRGSVVIDTSSGTRCHIPIYPAQAIDTTGAGDAYSGGFLEGLVETGDLIEAGFRGTISASFAVDRWGALGLLPVPKSEAVARLDWLRGRISAAELGA